MNKSSTSIRRPQYGPIIQCKGIGARGSFTFLFFLTHLSKGEQNTISNQTQPAPCRLVYWYKKKIKIINYY